MDIEDSRAQLELAKKQAATFDQHIRLALAYLELHKNS